jgi:glycerol kinase
MQFQADILGRPVRRPACVESTALGAAYLAGLSSGFWQSTDEIEENWRLDRTFSPAMDRAHRTELLAGWAKAVDTALFWGRK